MLISVPFVNLENCKKLQFDQRTFHVSTLSKLTLMFLVLRCQQVFVEASKTENVKILVVKVNQHYASNGHEATTIEADNAKENGSKDLVRFCQNYGVSIMTSPSHALQINGVSELLIQEHCTRARVLTLFFSFPQDVLLEALYRENWLTNKVPFSFIERRDFSKSGAPLLKSIFR